MKRFSRTFFSAIGAALGAGATVWAMRQLQDRFRQETETAIETLKTHSLVINTFAGPVEISIHGEGPPGAGSAWGGRRL